MDGVRLVHEPLFKFVLSSGKNAEALVDHEKIKFVPDAATFRDGEMVGPGSISHLILSNMSTALVSAFQAADSI